MYEVFI
jgi:hypothetical protein